MAGSLELGAWSTGHARSKATQSRKAGGQGAWGMVHGAQGREQGA